jgi:hypothetical protein
MAFIHEGSCECASTELDLFSVPPTQTSVESGKYVEYRPVSTLQNGSPIEFDIASSGDDYIDFANSYLHLKVKITRANGNNLADDDAVGPVNNFLHSLFSQVDVFLNGILVISSSNTVATRRGEAAGFRLISARVEVQSPCGHFSCVRSFSPLPPAVDGTVSPLRSAFYERGIDGRRRGSTRNLCPIYRYLSLLRLIHKTDMLRVFFTFLLH